MLITAQEGGDGEILICVGTSPPFKLISIL